VPATKINNAILVGVSLKRRPVWEIENSLEELGGLAKTADYSVCGKVIQGTGRINPRCFIGEGKLEELLSLKESFAASLVIFDDDLSPAQCRNLEKALDCAVVDRCGLILDIFNRHARSREAKTQVQLAHLEYLLPRLTGRWSHLSRQKGGIGLREVGEKQLELDRRIVRKEIYRLQDKLKSIDNERHVQRKARDELFKAAIVGYTNVGKSTLMNRLTMSNLFVEDRLFATLDACTRTLKKSGGKKILITDTVGFIDKLPHSLVASFKATLDEVRSADLLIKMIDIAHPRFEAQMASTQKVIGELESIDKPNFWVFNKVDRVPASLMENLRARFPGSICISAAKGDGCEELILEIIKIYEGRMVEREVVLAYQENALLQKIRKYGHIITEKYTENGILIHFRMEGKRLGLLEKIGLGPGKK
jgi:GTP-binding protein HflX